MLLIGLFLFTMSPSYAKNVDEYRYYSLVYTNIIPKKISSHLIKDTTPIISSSQEKKQKRVWITAYWSYPKQDEWTHEKKSSTGTTLKEGKHVAVDPDVIPYGSKIQLPDGTIRKAVDTGSAVKQRTASKGKYIVIDVYFTTKETAERWLAKYSQKQWVTILSSKA